MNYLLIWFGVLLVAIGAYLCGADLTKAKSKEVATFRQEPKIVMHEGRQVIDRLEPGQSVIVSIGGPSRMEIVNPDNLSLDQTAGSKRP